MALFPRKASLFVANASGQVIDLSAMNFHFEVYQHDLQTPNNMVARVFNLSQGTEAALRQSFGQESGGQVVLQAGYPDNFGAIFSGDVTFFRSGKVNPTDSFLDIQAIDGDLAYCFGIVSQPLEAEASNPNSQLNVLKKALADAGVSAGYTADLPTNNLPRGKVMFGMLRDHLEDLARTHRVQWSIQQGKLQLTPIGGYLPNQAIVLNSASGLIGLPEIQPDGLHVRALINPGFKPGQLLLINNKDIVDYLLSPSLSGQLEAPFLPTSAQLRDGVWQIMVCNFFGGMRENDYYADMICLAPTQPVSPSLLPRLL